MRQLYFFGDSVIKGVIHENGRYCLCPDHDYRSLQSRGIFVHNHAKMGAGVRDGLAIMRRRLPVCSPGDAVLICFGGNDSDYSWAQIAEAPDAPHFPRTSPEAFSEGMREAISFAQSRCADVAVASLVPLNASAFFKSISDGRDAAAILRWLGDESHLCRWQEYYSALACEQAVRLGCPVIDLRARFLQCACFPMLLSDDGIHPSRAGHRLIHRVLTEHFL